MFNGILLALAACFIWGLIFVIPPYIRGFDSFEIALGRHFVYGIVSCLFILFYHRKFLKSFSAKIWGIGFFFALIVNILYYSCVVIGVKYASPSLTALILGISPVLISFYGNWLEKECRYQTLIVPSFLIILGLLCVNIPVLQMDGGEDRPQYLIGAISAFVSLVAWSWYVVANTRFLKKNPDISSEDWSTLMGTATFIWVLLLGLLYEGWLGFEHFQKFITPSSELWTFLSGSLILGVLCSWVGAFLWNQASTLLPVSFAGQLTVFETIFGLLFFYSLEQKLPPVYELLGIAFMLSAILYGLNAFKFAHANTEKAT